jgi:hypothetical protein
MERVERELASAQRYERNVVGREQRSIQGDERERLQKEQQAFLQRETGMQLWQFGFRSYFIPKCAERVAAEDAAFRREEARRLRAEKEAHDALMHSQAAEEIAALERRERALLQSGSAAAASRVAATAADRDRWLRDIEARKDELQREQHAFAAASADDVRGAPPLPTLTAAGRDCGLLLCRLSRPGCC